MNITAAVPRLDDGGIGSVHVVGPCGKDHVDDAQANGRADV